MKIFNQTRKTILADKAVIADSVFKRTAGLLGEKAFVYGQALVLKPCKSVHTYFMSFPIDLVFVDKNNTVVKTVTRLKPFRLSPICLKSRFVIELPIGAIKITSTASGDQLTLE
jgi:hypothetical protein